MATPGFLSKRVKRKSQTGLTTDRYEFLGLDQAEPDLGDPLVGLSSIGANPAPIGGSKYVLIAAGGNTGKRYWVDTSTLSSTGLIPGSFTVFNNSIQVGAANSFNKFNFVGSGVTVDPVSSDPNLQTGIATVRITVTDLVGPGNVNSIPYKASNGLLAGATDFVYSSTNTNVGIGSTQPTVKLDVVGDMKVLGIVTASSFVGNLTGTATTATTALGFSTSVNINTTGIITASSFVGNLTGTATTANNVSSTININTSGVITATTFYGNLIGSISTTGQSFETIRVTGLSTFTNGPILVGTTTATGTSTQPLQVTGGAYVSGNLGIGTTNPTYKLDVFGNGRFTSVYTSTINSGTDVYFENIGIRVDGGGTFDSVGIGTTNPLTPLQVETYGVKTGVGTFTASVGVSTTIDSFSVSSTDFKIAEYTVHIGFGSYIQAQKVFVMQDQTTAYTEEYAVMYNNSLLVSIGATISGGNCILQATPQTGVSGLTTYRFARNTLL